MLKFLAKKVFGSSSDREVKRFMKEVEEINQIEEGLSRLSDEQLQGKTQEFKERLEKGETLDDVKLEAFAVVKNTCRRFKESKRMVNVRGQEVLWEMVPYDVQVVGGLVLNDGKIAEMATGEGKTLTSTMPCYLNALTGKSVHVVTVNDYLAARDSEWMGEVFRFLGLRVACIQHGQGPLERKAIYEADIVYGTNSEFGFDYLRDNGMATTKEEQVQRGHYYTLIDEVDSILIDEARTPLIISGPVTVSTHQFDRYRDVVGRLVRKQNEMLAGVAAEAKKLIDDGDVMDGARLLRKVKMGAPTNGMLMRMMEDAEIRRAIDDAELELYQDPKRTDLYALKEELYFSIDQKTSDADLSENGRKFMDPKDPDYFVVPDLVGKNVDIDANEGLSAQEKAEAKQKTQFEYEQSSQRIHNITQLLRAYCVYQKDKHYIVQDNKVVIIDENTGRAMPGRRWSDGLHQAVEAKERVQIDKETQTLATITIQNYFRLYEKLSGMTGTAETEANEFHDIYKLGVVSIPTNRPCLRDDSDDLIFISQREKYKALVDEIRERNRKGQPLLVGTASVESSEAVSRLLKKANIIHSVLNAKFHQQEAEIVQRAGQRGAVTIATNMAGRGTDIKLGEGVADLGGLHVVGTERHESRRIDRQLRGRCARQGDPGSSQFYISFEDDLMRNFGDSRKISGMMTRLGMEEDEGLQHPLLNRSVENAQKRVEQRNYQIRKHTLQYDDVMNQQRSVIYDYRTEVMHSEDLTDQIFDDVDEVVEAAVMERCSSEERDVDGLLNWLNTTMPLGIQRDEINWEGSPQDVGGALQKRVRDAYDLKSKWEDPVALRRMERFIVLGAIDKLWQEHLYAMDGLRQSIGNWQYAQKDPLVEYKREGFEMFEEMMQNIKTEIVHNLFRTATSLEAFENFLSALPQRQVHNVSAGFGEEGVGAGLPAAGGEGGAQASEPEKKSEDMHLPLKREQPKVGRNDPCPCGSGKKYKKCCGVGV